MKRMLSILILAATMTGVATASLAHGPKEHGAKPAKLPAVESEDKPFGRAGDAKNAGRTITVQMTDTMRFEPAEIRVRKGETVRVVGRNGGKVLHELVLGTMAELKEHAEMMRKHPGMEHDEPYMAHVQPGGREEIVWLFDKPGEFYYACLIPGHFEAGMVGKVIVSAN